MPRQIEQSKPITRPFEIPCKPPNRTTICTHYFEQGKSNKMANIGYIRVSTTQQNADRQLKGIPLDKTFEEKVSAKDMNRPALQALLSYVREGDTIHVHDLSRLSRSTLDTLALVDKLSQKGIKVHFHKEGIVTGDDSPMAKMMLTIIAAVATAERELMLERQAEGYAAAKAAGRIVGRGNSKSIDRKAIHTDFTSGLSINAVAKKHSISTSTAKRIKDAM